MERRQRRTRKGTDGAQLKDLLAALRALRSGDFSIRLKYDTDGIMGEIADAFNEVVTLNEQITGELVRINTAVGLEGNMAERASMGDVRGGWKTGVDSINSLIVNLGQPTAETAGVLTAVARGDLSRKIALEINSRKLQGEFLAIGNVVNTMVDQLNAFASEVTRVAREVGTEGKLGGQAEVPGVSGVWKDLTDSVNAMAGSLTSQVRNIAEVTTAVALGNLSKKITVEARGEILELKDTINKMVDQLNAFGAEVTRVAREVGTEGKLGGQAQVPGVAGVWKDLTQNVNQMASNLTDQVRNIALVTTAVAHGDLSQKITVEAKGEILELKDTINKMVDQLNAFGSEVTRVAREVGTEGKLGGQAEVQGVSGVWEDLTDNVNSMASNLTGQVRGIARVVTAVANGDLRRKLTLEAKGEIAELAETINSMIGTLATFADQVTTVAREVGVEGNLGGQARVPGAAGTWKDLTDNVNQLAANLTTQVRAIAEVATAVTQGDLTREIKVDARGEVAALKDTINEMIRNLLETTLKNSEQDWLKTNLAKFSRMLQGQKDLLTVSRIILSELAPVVSAHHGAFYVLDAAGEAPRLKLLAGYALEPRSEAAEFPIGVGLVGQCARDQRKIVLENVPPEYIRITSGLGSAAPLNILVLPVNFEGQVKGVIELASFERFNPTHQAFLDQLMESIGIVINVIEANMRTEELLKQSQSLADELEDKVEARTRDLQEVNQRLEEASRHKSAFLARMSHELRTPMNAIMGFTRLVMRHSEGVLPQKQYENLGKILVSAEHLLGLINDILDLSKIEAGRMEVHATEFTLEPLLDECLRAVEPMVKAERVQLVKLVEPELPTLLTDQDKLKQILMNLLSNAAKFTEAGAIRLTARGQDSRLTIAVRDTGIGIPTEKLEAIFEPFRQVDAGTARAGGTGLGLSISRHLARLLGGAISVESSVGTGSTFTLVVPAQHPRGRGGLSIADHPPAEADRMAPEASA